jgi:hypothetical protein
MGETHEFRSAIRSYHDPVVDLWDHGTVDLGWSAIWAYCKWAHDLDFIRVAWLESVRTFASPLDV